VLLSGLDTSLGCHLKAACNERFITRILRDQLGKGRRYDASGQIEGSSLYLCRCE
jgi:hypothetical protein